MAVQEGHLLRNPAELLFIPRDAKRPEHTVMTLKEVQICFAALEQRERIDREARRFSPDFVPEKSSASQWGHIAADACGYPATGLPRQNRLPENQQLNPEGGASQGIAGGHPSIGATISFDTSDDAWVFPSETGKTPMSKDNCWRRRYFGPQLQIGRLGWVDFHVMRRTHATLMNEIHDDPKLVADQLGHTARCKPERLYARFRRKAEGSGGRVGE